jgi:hypothetical protein
MRDQIESSKSLIAQFKSDSTQLMSVQIIRLIPQHKLYFKCITSSDFVSLQIIGLVKKFEINLQLEHPKLFFNGQKIHKSNSSKFNDM